LSIKAVPCFSTFHQSEPAIRSIVQPKQTSTCGQGFINIFCHLSTNKLHIFSQNQRYNNFFALNTSILSQKCQKVSFVCRKYFQIHNIGLWDQDLKNRAVEAHQYRVKK
jgi:hypothetical protein